MHIQIEHLLCSLLSVKKVKSDSAADRERTKRGSIMWRIHKYYLICYQNNNAPNGNKKVEAPYNQKFCHEIFSVQLQKNSFLGTGDVLEADRNTFRSKNRFFSSFSTSLLVDLTINNIRQR